MLHLTATAENSILKHGHLLRDRPGRDDLLMLEPSADYQPQYMDLREDFTFKRVFGTEINKDLLMHFLNSLFAGRKTIVEVEFRPTERQGEDKSHRTVIYDILCKEKNGAYFLIEMQRAPQDFFENRSLHYGCRLVSAQVPSGKEGNRYEIEEVYVISLLDFKLWEDPALLQDPLRRYLRSVTMSWTDTRERFGSVEWIFIQLPLFDKSAAALDNDLDRWLYLMKHLSKTRGRPPRFKAPAFEKLYKVTAINNLTRKELEMYTLTFDADSEWQNTLSYAKREGRQEGEAIGEKRGEAIGEKRGEAIGEKRGEAIGVQRGEAIGERKKARIVVQNLIKNTSFDDLEIASVVGVEVGFVSEQRRSVPG